MLQILRNWIQSRYHAIVNSIALYPALITVSFLLISLLMVNLDFSEQGKHIKSRLHWLSLKDADTARTIVSAIVTGIISLTVFSFSMVMIVLGQAASQMSNRVLYKLIGNRFQQVVLGIYIGTIVYALFLLSTIRSIDSGVHVPALSVYLLIGVTVFDIFIFIYFLHYITQSVKYEVIIRKIFKETCAVLSQTCQLPNEPSETGVPERNYPVFSDTPGIYTGFDKHTLLKLCNKNNCTLYIRHPLGTFLLEGSTLVSVDKKLPDAVTKQMRRAIHLSDTETIEENFFYGFRQLTEVAVKALSPGINDPGTAVMSLQALFPLLACRATRFPANVINDEKGQNRIVIRQLTFEEIFTETLHPIWHYGKGDPMVQQAMLHLLEQLQRVTPASLVHTMIREVHAAVHTTATKSFIADAGS